MIGRRRCVETFDVKTAHRRPTPVARNLHVGFIHAPRESRVVRTHPLRPAVLRRPAHPDPRPWPREALRSSGRDPPGPLPPAQRPNPHRKIPLDHQLSGLRLMRLGALVARAPGKTLSEAVLPRPLPQTHPARMKIAARQGRLHALRLPPCLARRRLRPGFRREPTARAATESTWTACPENRDHVSVPARRPGNCRTGSPSPSSSLNKPSRLPGLTHSRRLDCIHGLLDSRPRLLPGRRPGNGPPAPLSLGSTRI